MSHRRRVVRHPAFKAVAAGESWLVGLAHIVLLTGSRHPRVVLWLGGLWWLSLVVGP